MDKIRYLHIMTHPAMFFNGNIIEMINCNHEFFKPEEHLFIVGYQDIYDRYKKFNNIILINKIMTRNFKSFINYSKKADFVFLHQNWFYDYIRFIFTPISIRKKYIWCVWGPDLYTDMGKMKGLKNTIRLIARRIGDILINLESRFYRGIGIGFKYDALEVKRRFKKTDILMCPYPTGIKLDEINSIIQEDNFGHFHENKPKKIMVSHSAHPYLHHIEMLDKLSVYKNENIIISLPLVYGNQAYANEVEVYAKKIFGNKVEVIKERLDIKDYIRYLKTVDIGIFDQILQSGLGNLYYLLYLEKKIYVNKKGMFKLAFQLEGTYLDTTDNLGIQSYEQLIAKNPTTDKAKLYASFILDERNMMYMWKNTIDSI